MNIQLVVADIDGTFLNSQDQPSPGALEAIQRLRQQGIGFTLCSGRGNPGVRPYVELLNLDLPYIISSGAAVVKADGHTVIAQHVMSQDQVRALIELGTSTHSDMIFHTATKLFALGSDTFWKEECHQRYIRQRGWKNLFRCKSASELAGKPIIYLHLFNQLSDLPRMAEEVNALPHNLHANFVDIVLEITDSRANKGLALTSLAGYLKIPPQSILAIGDDINDLSMLQAAGIGVAMGNSPAKAKSRAEYHAPCCDKGGLAVAIDHLLAGTLDSLKNHREK